VIFKRIKILVAVFFLCSYSFCSFSQSAREIIIEGTVLSSKDHTLIPKALIVFKNNEGKMVIDTSDNEGHYNLHFKVAWFQKAEIYTQTNKDIRTSASPYGFLASDDRLKIDVTDSLQGKLLFKKDFYLTPIEYTPWFNAINFKKNSTSFEIIYPKENNREKTDSNFFKPAITIHNVKKVMDDNTSIIIELSAHCSINEKNVDSLSLSRAQTVLDELIKAGISKNRIVAKGYGIKKQKITAEMIAKAKTKEEKEYLHSLNRRVVFKILSWDYQEEKK
jgi:hypothetical protein